MGAKVIECRVGLPETIAAIAKNITLILLMKSQENILLINFYGRMG